MNRLKGVAFAGIAISSLALTPALMADTVELYYGPYAYYVGGEFTAVTSPNYNGAYSPLALVNATDANNVVHTGFETFCVQTDVDFTPYNWGNTTPYNFTISLASIGAPDNFALSEGTAFLYSLFATGSLPGYDYTGATRATDAGYLQAAIWQLQGGQSYPGMPSSMAGNPYYTLAATTLGANLDTAATLSTDFGVEIMNLTDANGNPAQNQLIYVGNGVPDGGTTVALLGLSLAGIGVLRKSIKR